MSDFDSIIHRHKQRLEEHQKFLDSPTGAPNPRGSAPTPSSRASSSSVPRPDDAAAVRKKNSAPRATEVSEARTDSTSRGRRHQDNSVAREVTPRAGDDAYYHDLDPHGLSDVPLEERGKYYTSAPLQVHERGQLWSKSKELNVARQREELEQRALEGCSFRPNAQQASRSPARSASYQPAGEPPGLDAHITRQMEARQRRDALQHRLSPDTSKWVPRTTKPKEFVFNRKDDLQINALQKPAFPHAKRHADPVAAARPTSTFLREPQRQAPRNGAPGRTSPAPRSSAPAARAVPGEDLIRRVDEQEEEIARLNSVVMSLKKELEVAKAKVRHLTLSSGI